MLLMNLLKTKLLVFKTMPECDKFLEYPRYLVYPIGQKRLGGGRRIVQEVWGKRDGRRMKVYSKLTQ